MSCPKTGPEKAKTASQPTFAAFDARRSRYKLGMKQRKRTLVGHGLSAGISLCYVLSLFVPSTPVVQHGEIEDSYMQVLHTAFAGHWQFGRDICYSFGPWGFLYGGYLPSTQMS